MLENVCIEVPGGRFDDVDDHVGIIDLHTPYVHEPVTLDIRF
jgi:hypothetical protein